MLLTLSTTHTPATDLGYLLGKHPDKCQTFHLAYGDVHVFYPEADEHRCTAAVAFDFDPVGLVRGGRGRPENRGTLAAYVNDRPYAASSFFSVAIAQVLASAMKRQSRDHGQLTATPIPLEATLSAVNSRGGEPLLRALFEPLGYEVEARRLPLDEQFPSWGEGRCFSLTLQATTKLSDLLTHLYVLIPVLDDHKHYWVGDDELQKLLDKGGEWLPTHPHRDQIVQRYLKRQKTLVREALDRLIATDPVPMAAGSEGDEAEAHLERPISLNEQRIGAVVAVLRQAGVSRVLDLGCGEGRLLAALLRDKQFSKVRGADVSTTALERAATRLKLDLMPEKKRERVELFQASLTYRDARFADCDAACAIEVIEHIDPCRLPAVERVLFEFARPSLVVVSTPNVEHNVRFETLVQGRARHPDHRFEWTRAEFRDWSTTQAERHGYAVRFVAIGPDDAEVGPPTQMAVFTR